MPGSGVVSLDGADLRQYPLAQLRQAVSYVSELPGVLPGTLRENLLLANPLLSDSVLEQGLRDLALDELLEGKGLNRLIRLQGPDALMAHQLQGVALCRALIKESSILLLDQPLNRLTPASKAALLQQLQRRRAQQTTLVAADQPELLQIADRIVVLKDGTVAFSGTPAELLAAQQQ
ncbi:MAG: ATP-binding cassette domain-containing protein [Cyanobacteria bacterium K_DeepCast_35m_m2_023]|nr:ATP-binding cassette domain-containing protein [Cyanobacteria bacterium K_DeepCast_35m_m2_023]